ARGREFHDAVAVVDASAAIWANIECAVTSCEIGVEVRVTGESAATLPDASLNTIRRCVPDSHLCQRMCVIHHDPAVIRSVVAMGRPANHNLPVLQQESWALRLRAGIKRDGGTAVPTALNLSLDHLGTAKFFRSRGYV